MPDQRRHLDVVAGRLCSRDRLAEPNRHHDLPPDASQVRALAIGFGRAISTDVLIKLDFYDVSRRKKPLKKQTKGKKRLKATGRLEVLQKPFLAVIELNQRVAWEPAASVAIPGTRWRP